MNPEKEEIIYEHAPEDASMNNYNWHILSLCQSTMDIQLNVGRSTLGYITKYITKSEDMLKATLHGDAADQNQGKKNSNSGCGEKSCKSVKCDMGV